MKSTARTRTLAAAGLVSAAVVASLAVTNASAVTPRTNDHTVTSQPAHRAKPTVVLVHGAFADSSSWNSEIGYLRGHGYPVYAIDTPLRGLAFDSAYVEAQLKTVKGPVV
ncbi:lysophospholipase, partial [Streptomyces sp. CME 23]|nr:lysophospholipase [Streptomyces sp. CME 23]